MAIARSHERAVDLELDAAAQAASVNYRHICPLVDGVRYYNTAAKEPIAIVRPKDNPL
jgi:hypothetical protein